MRRLITKSKINESSGFTVVEVMVATVVTSILLMAIMSFMADALYSYSIVQARRDLLSEAQVALDSITEETRSSANADQNNRWQDANAPGAPSNQLSWASNSSTLILASAAEDSSGNVIFSDPAHYITEKNNNIYYVSGGTLYKRVLASPATGNVAKTTCPASKASASCPADKVLITGISSFTAKYIDSEGNEVIPTNARAIELVINISKVKYKHTITADYKTRMVFRND